MLIGITGTDGGGKGTVVEYLVGQKGFTHYSARELFIKEIERQGIENNRANMRLVANQLRAKHGNDFLVSFYLKRMKAEQVKDAVIESIRATAEAKTLKQNGGILLAVDADQGLRYERIQSRKSTSDQVSFEEFVKHEDLEMNDPDPHGLQKARVIEMSDHKLTNDSTVEELRKQIDTWLDKVGYKNQ